MILRVALFYHSQCAVQPDFLQWLIVLLKKDCKDRTQTVWHTVDAIWWRARRLWPGHYSNLPSPTQYDTVLKNRALTQWRFTSENIVNQNQSLTESAVVWGIKDSLNRLGPDCIIAHVLYFRSAFDWKGWQERLSIRQPESSPLTMSHPPPTTPLHLTTG